MSNKPINPPEVVSSDFPFTKEKVRVLDSQMVYVDVGKPGSIIAVFLHGNPTSSYLWRNVLPVVAKKTRCIAPDLIGFGDSDKVPALAYRVSDHQRYVDAFLDMVVPHQKIVLILHDWGSTLGFDWARRHEGRVAGLAFMEFIPPLDSWEDFSEGFAELFRQFRQPGLGRKLLIDENVFVEKVLPRGVARSLGEAEMNHYRRPFLERDSREPIYRFPNEIPIGGEPSAVWKVAKQNMAWLFASDLPKLFFWAKLGSFLPEYRAKLYLEQLRNTRSVPLGPGKHFVQEDHPHLIGREIAAWLPLSSENL